MYSILFDNIPVGRAEVKKEGLYYKFVCTCTPPNKEVHKVKVFDGETEIDLGICVPIEQEFTVITRIPIKRLKGDRFSFRLVSGFNKGIPVATGKQFEYLHKIEAARLQTTNGQPEIIIDSSLNQQDSDPSQEYQNKWE